VNPAVQAWLRGEAQGDPAVELERAEGGALLGLDLHAEAAKIMFATGAPTVAQRARAKSRLFHSLYSTGPETLREMLLAADEARAETAVDREVFP